MCGISQLHVILVISGAMRSKLLLRSAFFGRASFDATQGEVRSEIPQTGKAEAFGHLVSKEWRQDRHAAGGNTDVDFNKTATGELLLSRWKEANTLTSIYKRVWRSS